MRRKVFFALFLSVAIYGSDPAYGRIFFSPTAYTMGRGNVLFSLYQIFLPSFTFGLTDRLDLAGGISLLPGTRSQFFYIAPKFAFFKGRGASLALGGLLVSSFQGDGGGMAYGVFTVGRRDSLLSLGLALPFYRTKVLGPGLFFMGGSLPLSRSFKFMAEAYIIPGEGGIIGPGIRFFSRNLAIDFAVMYFTYAEEGLPFFPWLGISYKFAF